MNVASRAMADSRMVATVQFHQRGYAGSKATLVVRDGDKPLAAKEVTLVGDGASADGDDLLSRGGGGGEELSSSRWTPLARRRECAEQCDDAAGDGERRAAEILYVEGEPRWEYKFIRRAEEDDKTVQVVSMLRTTENKIYRQGISDPKELEDGFPVEGGGPV